jgi:hypothetical protein
MSIEQFVELYRETTVELEWPSDMTDTQYNSLGRHHRWTGHRDPQPGCR